MRAMVFESPKQLLRLCTVPTPEPQEGQVLLQVRACGVCRTDLHIYDGDLSPSRLPLILGHQIVGTVAKLGPNAKKFTLGERIGVAWLGKTCGECNFCLKGRENLCEKAKFTGYDFDGGFAEFCVAYEDYCYALPDSYSDAEIAPLLCGGLIGLRALEMTGDAQKIGFYGFGSSAHILIQIALLQDRQVYVFTKGGDKAAQNSAMSLGATWAGSSEEAPPELLNAAILFASAGELVPKALQAVDRGGIVVCAEIHMNDIPTFPYKYLFGERILRSVTHLKREDAEKFLKIAKDHPLHTNITCYSLEQANLALQDLREGKITGSAVLFIRKSF